MLDDCGGERQWGKGCRGAAKGREQGGSGKGEAVGWTGRMGVGRGAMGRQRRGRGPFGRGPFGRGDREGGKGKEVRIWPYYLGRAGEGETGRWTTGIG